MDIITKKHFEKFIDEFHLNGGSNDKNFEKFMNYLILSTKNISNFDLSSVSIGDGGDCGIDGFGIAVNGKFVSNSSDLQDLIKLGMELSIEFHFIQTKMAENFDGKEILQFGNGVCNLFKDRDSLLTKVKNEKLKDRCKMIEIILDNYDLFCSEPKCSLYYATTGNWIGDVNLECDVQKIVADIKNIGVFGVVEFYPIDCKEIREYHKLTHIQNIATFELSDKIEIPYMEGIKESYLAIMPIKNFMEIILDADKRIKKGIFELNVRDFEGIENNRVNQDIVDTIKSDDRCYFGLLNNGITIVGKSLNKVMGKYTIKNFYIVNGCQTSNVLFQNLESIDASMWVSVKIVITEDESIIKNIVKATNNQTEVQQIQLLSMSDYQELLESYYDTFDEKYKLYYERRSGQYNSDITIEKTRIVTPELQIRSFASVFLDAPHKASRFYGSLYEDIDKRIFVNGHRPIMYYASELLHNRVNCYFLNDEIEGIYLKFKYHILMIISKLIWKNENKPQMNSRKMDEYCLILINKILDPTVFKGLLLNAIDILRQVIPKLDDFEANKSNQIVNSIHMFIDSGLTRIGLRARISFNEAMTNLLAPFYNISLDGDLRYNFADRLDDLIGKIEMYGLPSTANNLGRYKTKVDIESRRSRKECAKEIYEYINAICDKFSEQIERAKKYTDQPV